MGSIEDLDIPPKLPGKVTKYHVETWKRTYQRMVGDYDRAIGYAEVLEDIQRDISKKLTRENLALDDESALTLDALSGGSAALRELAEHHESKARYYSSSIKRILKGEDNVNSL